MLSLAATALALKTTSVCPVRSERPALDEYATAREKWKPIRGKISTVKETIATVYLTIYGDPPISSARSGLHVAWHRSNNFGLSCTLNLVIKLRLPIKLTRNCARTSPPAPATLTRPNCCLSCAARQVGDDFDRFSRAKISNRERILKESLEKRGQFLAFRTWTVSLFSFFYNLLLSRIMELHPRAIPSAPNTNCSDINSGGPALGKREGCLQGEPTRGAYI